MYNIQSNFPSFIPYYVSPEEQKQKQEQEETERLKEIENYKKQLIENHKEFVLQIPFGELDLNMVKQVKKIIETDDDYTYIYAGNKDRFSIIEDLKNGIVNTDDICGHIVKSKIKNNHLICEVEYEYTEAGSILFEQAPLGFQRLMLNYSLTNEEGFHFNCFEIY